MYSRKLTECGLKQLLSYKTWIKEKKLSALPVSKTTGMKDAVMKLMDGHCIERYPDYHDRIMMDSELYPNGYLKPRGAYMADGYILSDDNRISYTAFMEAYDKYLCTDGVIRYRPTPESDLKYKALHDKLEKEFWDEINSYMESIGYIYDENECYWYNPETGEEYCY